VLGTAPSEGFLLVRMLVAFEAQLKRAKIAREIKLSMHLNPVQSDML
jgi:hypothetical protein